MKGVTGVLVGLLLFAPALSFAQTTSTSDSALIAELIQLVQTVQQEVAALQAEVNALSVQPSDTFAGTTSTTSETPQLTLTIGTAAFSTAPPALSGATITWTTNIPATSKLFLTQESNGAMQVLNAPSGNSTQGEVSFGLTSNQTYAYTIEAINGDQDQKLTGVITTSIADPSITVLENGTYQTLTQ